MQVLVRKSEDRQDIYCTVCDQGFRLYWERPVASERDNMRRRIDAALASHHTADRSPAAHPEFAFNVPEWLGPAQFSAAALLGGLSGIRRVPPRPRPDHRD